MADVEDRLAEAKAEQSKADAASLARFLEEHRYTGVNSQRRSMLKAKYPLHTAVKRQDINMIRVLLEAQADRTLKSSSGETPFELAARLFKRDRRGLALVQEALQG